MLPHSGPLLHLEFFGGGGGGILGPLYLFSFINNLPSVLSEGTQSALYSDDTKLYFVLFPGQPIVKDFD